MNDLREFRQKLGLTQGQLAGLLGITEGLFSMIEIGKRQLPSSASHILTRLKILLEQVPEPGVQPMPEGKVKVRLDRIIRTKERELRALQLKLEPLEEKLDGLILLQGLARLPETETLWQDNSEQSDHWNLIQRKTGQKFIKIFSEIIKLKINMSGLEAALETARSEKF